MDRRTQIGPLVDAQGLAKVRAHVDDALSKGATRRRRRKPGRRAGVQAHGPDRGQARHAPARRGNLRSGGSDRAVHRRWRGRPPCERHAVRAGRVLWTRDLSRAFRVAEALDYGIVGVNDGIPSTAQAPFGGMKMSGVGREGGTWGIEEYLDVKYMSFGFRIPEGRASRREARTSADEIRKSMSATPSARGSPLVPSCSGDTASGKDNRIHRRQSSDTRSEGTARLSATGTSRRSPASDHSPTAAPFTSIASRCRVWAGVRNGTTRRWILVMNREPALGPRGPCSGRRSSGTTHRTARRPPAVERTVRLRVAEGVDGVERAAGIDDAGRRSRDQPVALPQPRVRPVLRRRPLLEVHATGSRGCARRPRASYRQ